MDVWSKSLRAAVYLSIEGALALGFIISVIVPLNPADLMGFFSFTYIIVFFDWFGFFILPQVSKKILAITFLYSAIFPFLYAMFLPLLRAILWAVLFWLPIVLMSFLKWRLNAFERLRKRREAVALEFEDLLVELKEQLSRRVITQEEYEQRREEYEQEKKKLQAPKRSFADKVVYEAGYRMDGDRAIRNLNTPTWILLGAFCFSLFVGTVFGFTGDKQSCVLDTIICLTGTQFFLVIMIGSSLFFISDLIFNILQGESAS